MSYNTKFLPFKYYYCSGLKVLSFFLENKKLLILSRSVGCAYRGPGLWLLAT
jgi:hypothetical protein